MIEREIDRLLSSYISPHMAVEEYIDEDLNTLIKELHSIVPQLSYITVNDIKNLQYADMYDKIVDLAKQKYREHEQEMVDFYNDVISQYEEKKKSPFKSKYKLVMSKIPQPIRAIVLFPLWYLGWLLMAVIEPLYSTLVAPYLSTLSYWLILLGLMLLIIIVASIFIFPALPLSKSINKKTISLSIFLILVFSLTLCFIIVSLVLSLYS